MYLQHMRNIDKWFWVTVFIGLTKLEYWKLNNIERKVAQQYPLTERIWWNYSRILPNELATKHGTMFAFIINLGTFYKCRFEVVRITSLRDWSSWLLRNKWINGRVVWKLGFEMKLLKRKSQAALEWLVTLILSLPRVCDIV